jgi:prepilin-type N-terminal cleavage/methylation domain-containing protein
MKTKFKHNGFSLTEVLMAVGILSVGMMLIATMFPVGIYLTSVAAERTMAAIVSDEAFAKIQLYGFKNPVPQPDDDANRAEFYGKTYDYEQAHNAPYLGGSPCLPGSYDLFPGLSEINSNEFSYPSVDPAMGNRQYYWSALCKKLSNVPTETEYLVTVFVSRKTSPNLTYYWHDPYYCYDPNSSSRPRVVDISVQNVPGEPNDKLKISEPNKARYVNPPTTILNNGSGRLYRVVDREVADSNIIKLDRIWTEDMNNSSQRYIWLVPPPNTGGKNANIEVFQRIIRF